MARLSPLQRKMKLKSPSASVKQKRAQVQVDVELVTLPVGKHIDIELENLSHDGRGVGRWQGKAVFVKGALQGEWVKAEVLSDHKSHAEAGILEIKRQSESRVEAICPVYETCGGCQLQHLDPKEQVGFKQSAIAEQLRRLADIEPQAWVQPIAEGSDGYRRRAQLATRYFSDSNTLLMGFRQSGHKHIVPIDQCPVLESELSALLAPLHKVLLSVSQTQLVTHIELLQAQNSPCISLKISAALDAEDQQLLCEFAIQQGTNLVCQQSGQADLWLHGSVEQLYYTLDMPSSSYNAMSSDKLTLDFAVNDFVQVNAGANQAMVAQALNWLELNANDQVLDLFCGVGNFALPIAKYAQHGVQVLAIEGDYSMVEQGRKNAHKNAINNVDFHHADLFEAKARSLWKKKTINKVLLDPPRAGAKGIAQLLKGQPLERVVYVSCHPASMARDLKEFQALGLKVAKMGCIDMFPHTTHLEVMALLVPK
ncbi:MAG: 23S rRNA (uracil(1939)-C(5))-methyltransferase RlmD [Gammaproteobacteria bacterium]|nr:23S rRNA (uracil(1939)-C(5))-methyltransferase RlmD [Gammaproteobacteria bacterium]